MRVLDIRLRSSSPLSAKKTMGGHQVRNSPLVATDCSSAGVEWHLLLTSG